jgi:hypothetical protein
MKNPQPTTSPRGREDGYDLDDWLIAQSEVTRT